MLGGAADELGDGAVRAARRRNHQRHCEHQENSSNCHPATSPKFGGRRTRQKTDTSQDHKRRRPPCPGGQIVADNSESARQTLERTGGIRFEPIEIRKSKKPATTPFQPGGAASQVTSTPATSSMQTNCGSFNPDALATRDDAHTPTTVTAAAVVARATRPCGRTHQ